MAFLACCATLSIWQAAYTPPRSGEHGLDLRPATGHFIHRRAASHDRREARSKRSSRLCAGRSDSRVYPPCQGVSGGAWRCQTSLPTASGLEHKVFVGPFARSFPNAGLCCSKPVELSAKPPAQLARISGRRRCSQRIALMPLASV